MNLMLYIRNQKIKFLKNLFTKGFCNPNNIKKIQVKERVDYIIINFILDLHINNKRDSTFYKVYKK